MQHVPTTALVSVGSVTARLAGKVPTAAWSISKCTSVYQGALSMAHMILILEPVSAKITGLVKTARKVVMPIVTDIIINQGQGIK